MSQADIDMWIGIGTIVVTLATLVWFIDPAHWDGPT